jgi:hypothetical protein
MLAAEEALIKSRLISGEGAAYASRRQRTWGAFLISA